jgi:hypothetical protein
MTVTAHYVTWLPRFMRVSLAGEIICVLFWNTAGSVLYKATDDEFDIASPDITNTETKIKRSLYLPLYTRDFQQKLQNVLFLFDTPCC